MQTLPITVKQVADTLERAWVGSVGVRARGRARARARGRASARVRAGVWARVRVGVRTGLGLLALLD